MQSLVSCYARHKPKCPQCTTAYLSTHVEIYQASPGFSPVEGATALVSCFNSLPPCYEADLGTNESFTDSQRSWLCKSSVDWECAKLVHTYRFLQNVGDQLTVTCKRKPVQKCFLWLLGAAVVSHLSVPVECNLLSILLHIQHKSGTLYHPFFFFFFSQIPKRPPSLTCLFSIFMSTKCRIYVRTCFFLFLLQQLYAAVTSAPDM